MMLHIWKLRSQLIIGKLSLNLNALYSSKAATASGVSPVPRIMVPHRMTRRIERVRAKDEAVKYRLKQFSRRGPIAITCKRQQFNHHVGQKYKDLSVKCLASGGWKHSKSKSDYFTINATQPNPALQDTVESFNQFGLHSQLSDALAKLKFVRPTQIQAQTIPAIMVGKNILCAAETGSGKTLAFLLPVIDKIFRYRLKYGATQAPNRPHGIVITPSRELAEQIYDVAKLLSEVVPFYVDIKCGGRHTQRLLRAMPEECVDLLVTTPGVLSKLLTNKLYDLSRLSHIIFDEVDTLLDDSFNSLSIRILQKLKVSGEGQAILDPSGRPVTHGVQITFVGATLPRDIHNTLKEVVPADTLETITTSHLHRLLPHVPQKFLRLGLSQRPEMLVTLLKANIARNIPTLVFCNDSSTVCYLGYMLDDNKIPNIILHANMPQVVRDGRFSKFQKGECDILVCTDIASRGLDTVRARHVINYEFPQFISDYMHRVGRVGRVGSAGACFAVSFISYPWDVDLLWKIESAVRLNVELPNVNANIKRKLTGIVDEKFKQHEL